MRGQDAALARLRAKDFDGTLLRYVDEVLKAPRKPAPPNRVGLLGSVPAGRGALRASAVPAGDLPRAAAKPRVEGRARRGKALMRVHQWVPAAHKGDAIGDSARRVRDFLRAMGHDSDIFALTHRRRTAPRRQAVFGSGGEARRRHHLSLRAALADVRGLRSAPSRPRASVSQRHAGAILRAVRAVSVSSGVHRSCRAGRPGAGNRPRARRLRLQPPGARRARVRADRRHADRRRHRTAHEGASAARARRNSGRRPRQFSVRRQDCAEQEDRGSHQAGRAVQAVRRRVLSVHLRRALRRRTAITMRRSGR